MKEQLLHLGVKLWVVDNIASLAPGLDENVKQERKQEVLKMLGEGFSQKKIVEQTGLSKSYLCKINKWAIKEGYLTPKGKLSITGKVHLSGISDD